MLCGARAEEALAQEQESDHDSLLFQIQREERT